MTAISDDASMFAKELAFSTADGLVARQMCAAQTTFLVGLPPMVSAASAAEPVSIAVPTARTPTIRLVEEDIWLPSFSRMVQARAHASCMILDETPADVGFIKLHYTYEATEILVDKSRTNAMAHEPRRR